MSCPRGRAEKTRWCLIVMILQSQRTAVPDEGGRRPVAAKMKQFWQLALLCWNCSIVSDRLPDCGDVSTLLAVYCRLRCRPPAPMSPVLSDPPTAPSRPLSPSSFLSPCSSRMQNCLVCLCSAHFARLVTRNRCILPNTSNAQDAAAPPWSSLT